MTRRRSEHGTPVPVDLALPGRVVALAERDDLYDALAMALMDAGLSAVRERGVFHLALSGGSTPEPFYMRLVLDPRFRAVPWSMTHVWIVDERRVPESDARSNMAMIRQTLTDHVPMKSRQLHPMLVLDEDPAGRYERELREVFECVHVPTIPRLDFVLLGMGDDGHTASLFPGSPALGERERLVAVNEGPRVTPPARVTMTYPLLNAARRLAVLVTGVKKAATLRRVSEQCRLAGSDAVLLPITGVEPLDGLLTWYLDGHAAGSAPA